MSSSPSSTPPLPTSLLTALLPYLLPPTQLPQELVSKSLLQRILYLTPDPDDTDAHLTPFPHATDDQPISSRLRELARGHQLGQAEYTREGEEVFARVLISDELGQGGVEIWFEFEGGHEGSEGRGWVYHSARIATASSTSRDQWVSDPGSLPSLATVNDHEINADEDHADLGQAPAGYWDSFNSSPPSPRQDPHALSHDHLHVHEHHFHQQAMEDAYWAQYSRPATAPITPAPITPAEPLHPKELSSQEETAKKLADSLRQLGLDQNNGSGTSSGHSSGGFVHFDPASQFHGGHKHLKGAVSVASSNGRRGFYEPASREESGREVKDRLKAKIGSALHALWKEFSSSSLSLGNEDDFEDAYDYAPRADVVEGEMEEKAMEWLRISRSVVDNHSAQSPSSSSLSSSIVDVNVKPGYYIATSTDPVKAERVRAKLETLWEMYSVLNEDEESDNFFRLAEGVIVRQARAVSHGYGEDGMGDEVMRQEMYYE